MEKELRNFLVLTCGDVIHIGFNAKTFELEVAECQPNNRAVCIFETDVNVDFDGNHLPENQAPAGAPQPIPVDSDDEFDFNTDKPEVSEDEPDDEFVPFSGQGHRLGDKPSTLDKWKNAKW